ncbi:MAG: hypothetical protein QOI38_934 [Sphingomonadales bacterium]|nr:hypothetical protein [Sphingomonadales bacterium]
MKVIHGVTSFLLLCAASQARAVDWRAVAGNRTIVVYVDFDTIGRDGSQVNYWATRVFLPPIEGITHSLDRVRGDCTNMSVTVLQRTFRGGSHDGETHNDVSQAYAPPGTVWEDELEGVCAPRSRSGPVTDPLADAPGRIRIWLGERSG